MAYEADVHALAEHLAHLLAAERPVAPDELVVVDAARAAVRQFCWRILHDVATAPLGESPIADLGHRSVATLQHVLRAEMLRFAEPARPNTGWVDHTSSTPVGHHWREAHRHAVLAEHEWELIYPEAHPHGPDAWPIIIDVAAIAATIAHLDQHLARHATRTTAAADQAWALAFAAEQVRRLAPPGAVDADPAPLPSRRHQLLLRIRSAADAPAGTARLVPAIKSSPGAWAKTTTPSLCRVAVRVMCRSRILVAIRSRRPPTRAWPAARRRRRSSCRRQPRPRR